MIYQPCILTIRRDIDGGKFTGGDFARTNLFARALAFANPDKSKNFAYVDFEEDFHIPSIQDAAMAFGVRIIRSCHNMTEPILNIRERCDIMRKTGYEIPKIAFMPHSLDDVTKLFAQAQEFKDNNHILLAMGPLGVPTRLLSAKLKNFLTYSSPQECSSSLQSLAHVDPVTLNDTYHFSKIDDNTKIFGITGWPLSATSSPLLHNTGYMNHDMNSVYIPIRAEKLKQAFYFANVVGVEGMSVTIPHKEDVIDEIKDVDPIAQDIGACNTVVHSHDSWHAYNTDVTGFTRALLEFTGLKSLAHKKVAIIGSGGASKAIAYAVKKLHGNACIFNRTIARAKLLADKYDFKYASLSEDSGPMLKKYNDIIIQTTSKGMGCQPPSTEENDPIFFYDFTGKEMLFDIIYVPEVTPVMERAARAGCKVCNGYSMLKYQGYEQFELFTGVQY
ncbi:MAG: type I 3-dehydroquinate dehydratase, partial [Treponema sp.]|nr:type I 3-dehydroquinate dehydratase [Treponema sp.]